jgi:hypothetical protein
MVHRTRAPKSSPLILCTQTVNDYFWGVNAVVVNEFVQEYLFAFHWDAAQATDGDPRTNRQQWRWTPWP